MIKNKTEDFLKLYASLSDQAKFWVTKFIQQLNDIAIARVYKAGVSYAQASTYLHVGSYYLRKCINKFNIPVRPSNKIKQQAKEHIKERVIELKKDFHKFGSRRLAGVLKIE